MKILSKFFKSISFSVSSSARRLNYSTNVEATAKTESREKLIKVAIIGAPNAGKSTFINQLVEHRVCPTSNRVHTTRKSSKAIHVRHNQQMVLFDTPGLVTNREMKKHSLEQSFISAPRYSIQNSNLIAVIHDISNNWARNSLHPIVLETLEFYKKVCTLLPVTAFWTHTYLTPLLISGAIVLGAEQNRPTALEAGPSGHDKSSHVAHIVQRQWRSHEAQGPRTVRGRVGTAQGEFGMGAFFERFYGVRIKWRRHARHLGLYLFTE